MKKCKVVICCFITAFILTSTPYFVMCEEAETQNIENVEQETLDDEERYKRLQDADDERQLVIEEGASKTTLRSKTLPDPSQNKLKTRPNITRYSQTFENEDNSSHTIPGNKIKVYTDTTDGASSGTTTTYTVKPPIKVPVKYRVSYISNGGSAVTSQNVSEGSCITFLATPARAGYRFAGWYKDSALKIKFSQTEPIRKNMTLYAKWEQVQCTVWFDSNGGSQVASVKVLGDTSINKLPVSTMNGYKFAGWYTDAGESFSSADKIYTNTTLHARWELIIPDKPPDEAKGFIDVDENAWYYNDVQWAYSEHFMSGYNNAIFSPTSNITMKEAITILCKLSGEDITEYKAEGDLWYTPYTRWAEKAEIIDSSTFLSDKQITREELCILLDRFFNYTDIDYETSSKDMGFSDISQISESAVKSVQHLYNLDVISGKQNNVIDPKGLVTRAEICTMLHRIDELNA